MAAKTLQLVPLDSETRTALPTAEAAAQLNRAQQTLRLWHSNGTCPKELVPQVIRGRLAWPVAGIKQALGVA